jgi:predicted DNA-binding protein (UPF0251 family)
MVELSLREAANRHGVSAGGLSKAVHAGREIDGMALYRYAVVENGRIEGFEFPSWYDLPEANRNKEEETIFLTMEELTAQHSEFNRGKVEECLRRGWEIDSFPVCDWVVFEHGGLKGFEVPRNADFDGGKRKNASDSQKAPSASPDMSREDEAEVAAENSEEGGISTQAVGFAALASALIGMGR